MIQRIVPNIVSGNFSESKTFYTGFLDMTLVMELDWILTFAAPGNKTAQVTIIKPQPPNPEPVHAFISIEVADVNALYKKAQELQYEITYPITNEPWGVRRFFVKDPNHAIINILSHIE